MILAIDQGTTGTTCLVFGDQPHMVGWLIDPRTRPWRAGLRRGVEGQFGAAEGRSRAFRSLQCRTRASWALQTSSAFAPPTHFRSIGPNRRTKLDESRPDLLKCCGCGLEINWWLSSRVWCVSHFWRNKLPVAPADQLLEHRALDSHPPAKSDRGKFACVDPVSDGLRIDLQQAGDFVNRQQLLALRRTSSVS